MTHKVIIQPTALAELEAAYLFIRQKSPDAADRWLNGLMNAIESLADMPDRCGIARESREFDETIRQLLYGRRPNVHRALFVVRDKTVRVLHVRHAARRALRRDEI
jgi:plasmid stabilization system protein ParE